MARLYSYEATRHGARLRPGSRAEGATVTTRYERLKIRRRMQRRIRLVVEERRTARARTPDPGADPDSTMELPPPAIGRVAVETF